MSDILIKGMEMPHQGEFSHIRIYDNGDVTVEVDTGEEVYEAVIAHAVQIPPHGRCIDANEADEYAYDVLEICSAGAYKTPWEAAREMQRIYRDMPTIIPAETTLENEIKIIDTKGKPNYDPKHRFVIPAEEE